MNIEIISPDASIYSGEIHLIQLPGELGSFEIMDKHAPIIATLQKGKLKVITKAGEELFFDIEGGIVEAVNNKISVLTAKI